MTEMDLAEYLQKTTPTKYNTKRRGVEGVHGIIFRSMLEANYAQELELRRYAEDPKDRVDWWLYEVPFYLPTLGVRRPIRHVLDFVVSWGGGACIVFIEVKGVETPAGRVKRLWLETYLGQHIEVWRGAT